MSRKPTETKQKVLEAACELFAEKGHRHVTAQDICQKAGANIASINYYFGSKGKLYLEVWEHVHSLLEHKYFDPKKFSPNPDEAIEYFINARISAILDDGPGGWLPKIIHYEMSNPSSGEARDFIMKRMKEKLHFMYSLAKNFLGTGATDLQVNIARQSFHSQCIHLNIIRHHKKAFFAEGFHSDKENVKSEMIKIIMGGLRSYREGINGGDK